MSENSHNFLTRRNLLRSGALGLAAAGSLTLKANCAPTEPSGKADEYQEFLVATGQNIIEIPAPKAPTEVTPTEDNILGPYHRRGAPFRGKITPPLEPGKPLLIRGRVWSAATRKPLADALLDIWQANAAGRYDNDDPQNPPARGVFYNRARLHVDETGYYEYETILPGRYQIGPDAWRPAHIHYLVAAGGHKTLVTQLYFRGDPENDRDQFIKKSLIIDLEEVKTDHGVFHLGTFDIVLAAA